MIDVIIVALVAVAAAAVVWKKIKDHKAGREAAAAEAAEDVRREGIAANERFGYIPCIVRENHGFYGK